MLFSELNLHEQVLEGTKAAHFEKCMPVQEKVLQVSIEGSDVMVQSKTGSGKTAVYVITFLEKYLRNKEQGKNSSCLIIAPTRELAQQISEDAMILCSKVEGFHIGVFYGGVGYEHQRKLLQMGCDIYVGTPGRLLEFMQHKELDASRIDTFVIDEADRMFDMGFYPDVKKMFRYLPDRYDRQTLLFSATLEMRIRELAWDFMNDPAEIDLEPDHITVESITQELYHVAKSEKFMLLLQLLAVEKPETALLFTNSRHMAEELCARLRHNGYNADYLTGDLPQAQRQKALDKLKEGKTALLVATDVAARGLQIDDLPLVVNYDIPEDYENYV
ncbi:MAG: DEAD/DEAH box helicase, partial [Spirochaetales bacterium]|nr:DEAD/DEAH box helicase [Spirochaetales bacterium]